MLVFFSPRFRKGAGWIDWSLFQDFRSTLKPIKCIMSSDSELLVGMTPPQHCQVKPETKWLYLYRSVCSLNCKSASLCLPFQPLISTQQSCLCCRPLNCASWKLSKSKQTPNKRPKEMLKCSSNCDPHFLRCVKPVSLCSFYDGRCHMSHIAGRRGGMLYPQCGVTTPTCLISLHSYCMHHGRIQTWAEALMRS